MGATIKDIAKDTNLSLATISKYLNGKRILPENSLRIQNSIRRLGYTPNRVAQTLRSRRTNTVCILLPVIGDYFWGALCSEVTESMQRHSYCTIVASYDPFRLDQTEVYHQLLSAQVAGVILVPQNAGRMNLTALMREGGMPFVCLDQLVPGLAADAVTSDNRRSAYQATKYLLERGHRTLGLIGGELRSYTNAERLGGFLDACAEFSVPEEQRIVYGGDFTLESGARLFREMMTLPAPPTAVLTLGYFLTVAAIQELDEMNVVIPDSLSMISFDDDQIFAAFDPPVTVIVQDLPAIGEQACNLLIRRINGDLSGYPETRIIGTRFIERKSVKTLSAPETCSPRRDPGFLQAGQG